MYCCFYYCSVCEGLLSKLFVWLIILSVKQVYKICTHFFYMFLAIHQCDNDFVKSYLVYHKKYIISRCNIFKRILFLFCCCTDNYGDFDNCGNNF